MRNQTLSSRPSAELSLLGRMALAAPIVLRLARKTRRQVQAALESRIAAEQRATEALRGWRVATGEIIWSNETFRIFGHPRAPSVGLSVFQRIHPEDRTRVPQTLDRASSGGRNFDDGYRLPMPDGSIKHVHATAHAGRLSASSHDGPGATFQFALPRYQEGNTP